MAFPASFSTTADCPFMDNSASTLTVKLSVSQSGTPTISSPTRLVSFSGDGDEHAQSSKRPSSPPATIRKKGMSRMSQSGSNRIVNSESISGMLMGRTRLKSNATTIPLDCKTPQKTILEASTSWVEKARDFFSFGEDDAKDSPEASLTGEQQQSMAQTRQSVTTTLRRVLGCAGEVTLDVMVIGMETCEYLPVPLLRSLSASFLSIWKAVRTVSMHRAAFLSATRRCAHIMEAIITEVERAEHDLDDLKEPIAEMEKSFNLLSDLARAQAGQNFLTHYSRREETRNELEKVNDSLLHSLQMFNTKVQMRTYASICTTNRLLTQYHTDVMSRFDQLSSHNSAMMSPPLPADLKRRSAPPELNGIAASESQRTLDMSVTLQTMPHSTADLHEPTPAPEVVPALQELQAVQEISDEKQDAEDLEKNMRNVLKQSNDEAFFEFLGIDQSQTPEAIKTLQRILEDKRLAEARSERRLLHREFLESGIEALRRLSVGRNFVSDLPVWTITSHEIDKGKRIGMGLHSEVYKGTWKGKAVAIKQLSPVTPYDLFIREIKVWKALSHPNVLKLFGASSATTNPPWFFVSPYMENGTLVRFLKRLSQADLEQSELLELGPIAHGLPLSKNRTTHNNNEYRVLKEIDVYRILQDIAKGMEYLHCKSILHGDLKAANVLVDKDYRCVIADFGQSEIKSEVCRITGSSMNDSGTLRWKAPELLRNSGMLTHWTDIFAFAIVCIEVLSMGELPWGTMNDDDVRSALLDWNERPVIPSDYQSPMLHEIIQTSWVNEPEKRAPFGQTVARLARLKRMAGDGTDIIFEDEVPCSPTSPSIHSYHPTSPRPTPKTDSYCLAMESEDYITLPSPQEIDALRTEEEMPFTTKMPEPVHFFPNMQQMRPSRTDAGYSWDSDDDHSSDVESRCPSPPPLTEAAAEGRNERRYRYLLEHEFNASLTVPLWDPSTVQIGDVGYLSKPSGTFVTLFNSLKTHKHPSLPHSGLQSMSEYGNVVKGVLRMDKRNVARKGLDAVSGFLTLKSRGGQPVSRRKSFRLRAGHRCAHLYAESTEYHYMKNVDAARAWFKANVGMILHAYGQAHNIRREDLFLVISLLQASHYGLLVSHRHPEGQVHFNVFSGPKKGAPWGTFATDTKIPGGQVGPVYEESNPEEHDFSVKISNTNDPPRAVLLGRLRFKADSLDPTTAK
ncbi:hypothetical protein D9619_008927 [Psilocybe cf. subviscida]|uniref:Protein kinase domain-containing protein n=1 Tax=Psilocybe cf. subviscida TaxID=2480587 RepID=A0A8H5BW65_9AGAR|nr:hypothetical protein D9619_008927 [Psilocybe cf. subviscida]